MKKLFSFLLAIGILTPLSTFAFKADIGENFNIADPVQWDYYVVWWNINLNSEINWDFSTVAGKIFINGNINQDFMAVWWDLFINWNIWESARIAGGTIIFDGEIKKDLLLAGGNISISENSTIQWETKLAGGKIDFAGTANNIDISAGEITIQGNIKWDAIVRAEKITVIPETKILWDLYYESSKQNIDLENIVSWQITFKKTNYHNNNFTNIFSWFIGMRFAFLLIFGFILLLIGKKWIQSSLTTIQKDPRASFGLWILTYITLPIAAVILTITVIWVPFAFVTIMWFITILIFAKLFNVYFYTNLLIQKRGGYNKLNNRKQFWILLLCTLIFGILNGIDVIFTFFALGSVIRTHIIKKK